MFRAVMFISLIAFGYGFQDDFVEPCNEDLKNLKENPTVVTLYNTHWYDSIPDKPTSQDNLERAFAKYKYLLTKCCWRRGVTETCPTQEHERKFLEDHRRQIKIFEDKTGLDIDVESFNPNFQEQCDRLLKKLRKNPTVRTLYENMAYSRFSKQGELNSTDLGRAKYYYHASMDRCCQTEGVKETLPTEEEESIFLHDLDQETRIYKCKNPDAIIDVEEYGKRKCQKEEIDIFKLTQQEQCDIRLRTFKQRLTVHSLFEHSLEPGIFEHEELDAFRLEWARERYYSLINHCCNMEGVKETLLTKEQEGKFFQRLDREIRKHKLKKPKVEFGEAEYALPKCTKMVYEPLVAESCDYQLSKLKWNATVPTLFKNMPNSAVGKENDLNATHLAQAIYNYHKLIDHCCQAEGVKETLPTEEHEGQFLKDLIQRIVQYKTKNPDSDILLQKYGPKICKKGIKEQHQGQQYFFREESASLGLKFLR